jgi:hypothetical protein
LILLLNPFPDASGMGPRCFESKHRSYDPTGRVVFNAFARTRVPIQSGGVRAFLPFCACNVGASTSFCESFVRASVLRGAGLVGAGVAGAGFAGAARPLREWDRRDRPPAGPVRPASLMFLPLNVRTQYQSAQGVRCESEQRRGKTTFAPIDNDVKNDEEALPFIQLRTY